MAPPFSSVSTTAVCPASTATLRSGWPDMSILLGFSPFRLAPDMRVRTRFARGRHAVDDADAFAVDQDDAFVALAPPRQVARGDQGLAAARGEHFQQRVEVLVVGPHAKPPQTAVAEQWLQ